MRIQEYPRPKGDNGRGLSWFPSESQSREVVDRFLPELEALGVKWVIAHCGLADPSANDYLVQNLLRRDIMPVFLVTRPLLEPLNSEERASLAKLARHFAELGVRYLQVFAWPNTKSSWRGGELPAEAVRRAVEAWIPAAEAILEGGGLLGLFRLAPGGDYRGGDLRFLREALAEMGRQGRRDLYERLWVPIENRTFNRPPDQRAPDSNCFLKFLWYDEVIRHEVGRSLPIISTAAGTRLGPPPYGDNVSERTVADWTVWAFRYMETAPEYLLCYSPSLIGSATSGADDQRWEAVSWYRKDGSQQLVVRAVKALPSAARAAPAKSPLERYFPEADRWVRGAFLEFFERYGQEMCGLPLTEALLEGGLPTQYFERLVLEEYQPGQIRLRLAVRELLAQRGEVERLKKERGQLLAGLPSAITIAEPKMEDLTASLPRHAQKRFEARKLQDIKHLVIHHTATSSSVTPQRIAEYMVRQLERPGIGYHFFISSNGALYRTNELVTACLEGAELSRTGVGLSFAGNFTDTIPSQAQLESGARLLAHLLQRLGLGGSSIAGAKELMQTESPGRQWLEGQKWKALLLERIRQVLDGEKVQFPETKRAVRGSFLSFFRYYGPSVCGYPLTEVRVEGGLPTLYFQHLALEEYDLGRVRPRAIGEELLKLRRKASRQAKPIPKPAMQDLIEQLPRHRERQYRTRILDEIEYLVVHHTASSPDITPQQIAAYHVQRLGWPGIGYHFIIDPAGQISMTNRLETISYHTGLENETGVGVCLAGNFQEKPPPRPQLEAAARLLAWLLGLTGLEAGSIVGHGDLVPTECPGQLWFQGESWQAALRQMVDQSLRAVAFAEAKDTDHYLLLGSEADQQLAITYVNHFQPRVGTSTSEARTAHYVTIVGGTQAVPAATEAELRQAGCLVERIAGATAEESRRLLEGMVAENKRFLSFPA